MVIDQTRFDAFWRNPDRYRLAYELNIVPKARSFDLDRGLAFHKIVELAAKGMSKEAIDEELAVMGLHPRAIPVAWQLFGAFKRKYPVEEVLGTEQEFLHQIPGSPHGMVGRLDQVVRRNGLIWLSETKTANSRKNYDKVVEEWTQKKQADFEILGARSLGFEPEGVWVRVIKEGNPPLTWELEVRRSDFRLRLTELQVHQTCETILMYRDTFGIDKPWPHPNFSWPCSSPGRCEYEGICQQDRCELNESALEDFREREEHLEIVREMKEITKGIAVPSGAVMARGEL